MLKKLFGFDPAQNKLKTEIVAGITTFLTMAYILAVNPNIFSSLASQGMDTHAVFTATVLAAVVGTLIMAIYAKKPFGLAPGMGLNAFFRVPHHGLSLANGAHGSTYRGFHLYHPVSNRHSFADG